MKFNIYNNIKQNGEETLNSKVELELSLEEMVAGYKHTLDLLEHSYEIKSLLQGITDVIIETAEKVGFFKVRELPQEVKDEMLKNFSEEEKEKLRRLEEEYKQNKEVA